MLQGPTLVLQGPRLGPRKGSHPRWRFGSRTCTGCALLRPWGTSWVVKVRMGVGGALLCWERLGREELIKVCWIGWERARRGPTGPAMAVWLQSAGTAGRWQLGMGGGTCGLTSCVAVPTPRPTRQLARPRRHLRSARSGGANIHTLSEAVRRLRSAALKRGGQALDGAELC